MKKTLCMGLLAAMLLVGCQTDSSVNASVSSQGTDASETSSAQKVLSSEVASETVSSKAESVSSAASSKVTSSKVTSSEKASNKVVSASESVSGKIDRKKNITDEECLEIIEEMFSLKLPDSVKVHKREFERLFFNESDYDDSICAKLSVDEKDVKSLIKSFKKFFKNNGTSVGDGFILNNEKWWTADEEELLYGDECAIAGHPKEGGPPELVSTFVCVDISKDDNGDCWIYIRHD